MKAKIQTFGRFLSGMVMPNIGAFIAWGLLTALFIEKGWFPNEQLSSIVSPMLTYVLPILIAYQGGKMVGGDRGALMGAIATIGVICGTEYTMFMGAMIMGPLAGLVIKKFDKAVDGHIPAGFEMIVNNFSVGILGLIMAVIGYYLIGPFMGVILGALSAGVNVLVTHGILPLVTVFVEPAKILFLNNAINHGIFSPLGAEQIAETGKSVFYMIESNPGAGTGVLLAYMFFSKDKKTKDSAPGALIIHLFGGIHEIYFPYVLMNPLLLLAAIGGSLAAMTYYTVFDLGLSGPASPGSIIAFLLMAPKGSTLAVLLGVVIAAVVSFVIAIPIIRLTGNKHEGSLEDASAKMKDMKAASKGEAVSASADAIEQQTVAIPAEKIKHIVFACDAGMGSSAMGASVLKKKIQKAGLDIEVTHASVSSIPPEAQIVVTHQDLKERAMKSAPQARLVTITNFMTAPEYDELVESLKTNKE
ncbi:PTS mannitol transporter subunit IICB [Agathobacter sp.]|uniref:PTS mannitol transporter subunit IICB n=1 Tax=Agathobacter sp. TaxID=2021311 RepID=UPI002A91D172|nr:PTS mannitol transporter subunit IICBA [Agathobacter sp.]MDY5863228.1 PTS mannitol transporter subunit IICBA [Agathobacter sp.]